MQFVLLCVLQGYLPCIKPPIKMNRIKEIKLLHNKGFVILRASITNNSPIGWKRADPKGKTKWGYMEEMEDVKLSTYRSTFSAEILSRSHCGFYLGHGNLCCIDLDTKKTTIEVTTALKDKIIKALGTKVAIETTKSNGYHVYFLHKKLDNKPDWMGRGKDNWIELYYSKRFIASYLSNSKKYSLVHGNIAELKTLSSKDHNKLIELLKPFKGKELKTVKAKKSTPIEVDEDTWCQAENYTSQIESEGLDITGDNPTWHKIGMGFANAFGEKGFAMFNRVSQFSPLYNADTIKDDYTRFVEDEQKPKDKKVSIATFFKICLDNSLVPYETALAIKDLNLPDTKEFSLLLSKKESMAEHCHTVVAEFTKYIDICCLDAAFFYIYEHTHWVKRNARQVVDLLNNFVDRSDVKDIFRKKLRTLPYLEMMLKELRLITQRDALEPHTGDLKEGIYINMENGILHVNMKTGKRKLLDHQASYNFTTILPFGYDATAQCPRFDQWMSTQIPDTDLHEAYYAFVASCLTRHKADIIMLLAGETSTGKSSLIDITRRVIGIENSAPVSAGMLFSGTSEAQTQAMQMENKLLAYDFDSQPFKHLELLLKVAAQEPLPGWQMNVARRPVVNYGRLIIAMNPYNYSVFNQAVARRFITISMDIPVVKDNNVMPAIYENELPGIFNHILNIGVKHLLANNGNIKVTDEMKRATFKFHTQSRDSVRWFETRFVILKKNFTDKSNKISVEDKLKKLNPGVKIIFTTITEMYQQFRAWMEDVEGISINKIPQRKHFATDMKLLLVEDEVFFSNGISKRGVYLGENGDLPHR